MTFLKNRSEYLLRGCKWLFKGEEGIDSTFIRDGVWEIGATNWIEKIVAPDWVCVDIGANWGYYTCILAKRVAKVIAVEAMEEPIALLEQHLKINSLTNVSVIKAVCSSESDQEIQATFAFSNRFPYDTPDPVNRLVLTLSLDDLLKNEERIDLIKVDVDGYEFRVFEGAKETLKRQPLLLFEAAHWDKWPKSVIEYHSLRDLLEYLESFGYQFAYEGSPDDFMDSSQMIRLPQLEGGTINLIGKP